MGRDETAVLRTPVPGPMFGWVKIASYFELALFAALVVAWLAPGLEGPTAILGLAHGLGFLALAALIWFAVLRHEAPYTLLAATLTPVGPLGSVVAIHYIERKENTGRYREGGHAARPIDLLPESARGKPGAKTPAPTHETPEGAPATERK